MSFSGEAKRSISPISAAIVRRAPSTATLTVNVPNPGELALSGTGIQTGATKSIPGAGKAQLLIRAKGKTMRKLKETGKVKVRPKLTYTPTGGDPSTQSRGLQLKKL